MSEELNTLPTRQLLLAAAIQGLSMHPRDSLMPSQALYERARAIAGWAIRHRNNLAYEALGKDSPSEQRQRLGMPIKIDYAAAALLTGLLSNARFKQPDAIYYGEPVYSLATRLLDETRTESGDGQDRTMRYLRRVALAELEGGPLSEEEVVRFAYASGYMGQSQGLDDGEKVAERALLVGRHAKPE